jgi:hypothetical protein
VPRTAFAPFDLVDFIREQDVELRDALDGEDRDSWLARKMYLHEARMNTLKINLSYSPSVVALNISSLRSLQVWWSP